VLMAISWRNEPRRAAWIMYFLKVGSLDGVPRTTARVIYARVDRQEVESTLFVAQLSLRPSNTGISIYPEIRAPYYTFDKVGTVEDR
jgi:hypothetical protein